MQKKEKSEKQFLNTDQLAKRWNRSKRCIENWRSQGKGPNYYRIGGKPLYDLEEIISLEQESYIKNGKSRPPESISS
jgi:hypothetical protein